MTVYLEDILYGKGKNFKSSKRGKSAQAVKENPKEKSLVDVAQNLVEKAKDVESKKASVQMEFIPNIIKKNNDTLKIDI